MKKIAIYGAGGFGREVACMIDKINRISPEWDFIGFFDDVKRIGDEISHFGDCLGGINELNSWPEPLSILLCFGSPKTLSAVRGKITNKLLSFPNLVDPSFSIADPLTFSIGEGNIIKGHCGVTTDVVIGNFNVLNGHVNMGHDVTIGDYNVFMPGARISGEVTIGNSNLIGADSFIKQGLIIGDSITLSPLSALLSKPKDANLYIGNPAKLFRF